MRIDRSSFVGLVAGIVFGLQALTLAQGVTLTVAPNPADASALLAAAVSGLPSSVTVDVRDGSGGTVGSCSLTRGNNDWIGTVNTSALPDATYTLVPKVDGVAAGATVPLVVFHRAIVPVPGPAGPQGAPGAPGPAGPAGPVLEVLADTRTVSLLADQPYAFLVPVPGKSYVETSITVKVPVLTPNASAIFKVIGGVGSSCQGRRHEISTPDLLSLMNKVSEARIKLPSDESLCLVANTDITVSVQARFSLVGG